MLEKLNCDVLDFGILPDNQAEFEAAFVKAQAQADLDSSQAVAFRWVKPTSRKPYLEKVGQVNFWKIAMKPGKPFAFGKLENAWFCGLPGNPVSALVTFYQLVQPAIAKLSGKKHPKKTTALSSDCSNQFEKSARAFRFPTWFLSN